MENTTEGYLLEMSEHFKQLMRKKNNEIRRLKKFVALIYGLARTTDEQQDISLVETIRDYASDELNNIMGIDSDDE
ncbi:MAG: hypothetical protein H8E55_66750 [Pelagibacterales bacterium]|nr:hypothetical protein [Pelagibacterales bacterium]